MTVEQFSAYPGLVSPGCALGVHARLDGRVNNEPRRMVALLAPALADVACADLEGAVAAAEKASFELEVVDRRRRATPGVAGMAPVGGGPRDDVDVVVGLALRVRDRHGLEVADAHLREMLKAYPPSQREVLLRAAILALAAQTAACAS
jgi:hypothetical protein